PAGVNGSVCVMVRAGGPSPTSTARLRRGGPEVVDARPAPGMTVVARWRDGDESRPVSEHPVAGGRPRFGRRPAGPGTHRARRRLPVALAATPLYRRAHADAAADGAARLPGHRDQ